MDSYMLKHQNRDVAFFVLDTDGDLYTFEILDPAEMPVLGNGPKNLAEWIQNRAIPDSRDDLNDILTKAGCKTAQEYMIRNLALSLSDSYWICPAKESEIRWEDVSLYTHPTGELTFRNRLTGQSLKKVKSNSSLAGSLEKDNLYRSDGWHLVKKGDPKIPFGLQNINEAFVSMLHARQGFSEYTSYTLNFDAHGVCESCDCRYFTDMGHELVSAYNVTGGVIGQADTLKDAYREYLDICVANGLDRGYVTQFMDYMLLTDFLVTNTDRHWENFGILRDPDSLRFLSLAPIFDSGTSMVCGDPFAKTRLHLLDTDIHGICFSQQENLELIQNRTVVDSAKLPDTGEVEEFYVRRGVEKERVGQIAQCYGLKRDMLLEFQHGFRISIGKEYEYSGNPPYKEGKANPLYTGPRERIRFVVMCGIPNSGKEKAAQKYLEHPEQTAYIRTNHIREIIGLADKEDENRVFETAYRQIRQALTDRKDVVYVATNLDRDTRKRVLEQADGIPGVEKILSVVYKAPEDVVSDIPVWKLRSMAGVLNANRPDTSEGWDGIEKTGEEPVLEEDMVQKTRIGCRISDRDEEIGLE